MARSRKVVITCAVTGAIHTPSMSPHLPVTPDEIVADAVAAAEAGAAVLHLHARDPGTGKLDQTPEASRRFLPRIKQQTNAAINGGNVRVGLEDSLWIGPGQLATSNADQVRLARQIIEGLGLEIAGPDEAREILALKGADKVAI